MKPGFEQSFSDHMQNDKREFASARRERGEIRHLIKDTQQTIQVIQDTLPLSIQDAVEKTVNGKIRSLDMKVTDHMARVEPYLKAGEGVKSIGNVIQWISAVGIAIIAIKSFIN